MSSYPLAKINILLDLLLFLFFILFLFLLLFLLLLLLLLLLRYFLRFYLFYFYFFFVFKLTAFIFITAVLPLDLLPTFIGLYFFSSGYCGLTILFLETPLVIALLFISFFLLFTILSFVLDLFSIASPQDKLYFLLFYAIMNFKTFGSS